MEIGAVFCGIDDCCLQVESGWQPPLMLHPRHRHRGTTLALSEVMAILVWFPLSGYRTLKTFYLQQLCRHYTWAFPHPVSYPRFGE
jgi:hypothetical protein